MAGKTRAAAPAQGAKEAAGPKLLSGGNPQIAKGHGDAPVQAYIAAMPGWKSDVGRRLDALIADVLPSVRKAVKWNSPFYGVEDPAGGEGIEGRGPSQDRARVVVAAGEARGLPVDRRVEDRAVAGRGRLRPRHRQAGAQQRVPGAAAAPRQDPQRPEGRCRRERGVAGETRQRGSCPAPS